MAKDNPSNAIALMKIWKYNTKPTNKHSLTEINTKVREIVVECNNLFKLLDNRNQDILSLIEYIGETNESIEQINKHLQDKERAIAECDNIKNKIKDFLPNFDVYCDHLAIIQNHKYDTKISLIDKSVNSSTQTEPRNTQLGYFRRIFEQDCEQLMVKTNQTKSPYENDKDEFEAKLSESVTQIRNNQADESYNNEDYSKSIELK